MPISFNSAACGFLLMSSFLALVGSAKTASVILYDPPPPCQWPGPCFFFREGGAICKGGHVSSFERGGVH